MSQRSQRKEEHLALAKMFFNKHQKSDFNQIHLIRPALPESKFDEQAIETELFGKKIAAPFYINAMTGGSEKSFEINKRLAQAAKIEKIPFALGSASILAKEPEQLPSFQIARQENPTGLIFANVNPDTDPQEAQQVVASLQANALQIHLNSVQEAVMPEGDRNFYWLTNLLKIKETVQVPIIIKEVGQGIDPASLTTLINNGFKFIDLGGQGGTNFAQIENERRPEHDLSFLEDIGLSTPKTLLAAQKVSQNKTLFASGGITSSLDIFKSLVLGAQYVGLASHFLKAAFISTDAVITEIRKLKRELIMLTALYGLENIEQTNQIDYYLDTDLYNFEQQINKL